jgi:5-keto 4-deoxyuronate isomerase
MSFSMKTNYTHSPKDIEHYSTDELRDQFLMEKLFTPGDILLTYTLTTIV